MILLTTTINLIILTMISVYVSNRLELAKRLLRDDGVIFVQCDDNEQAYLKVLMVWVFLKKIIIMCKLFNLRFTELLIIKSISFHYYLLNLGQQK
nr:hypothetical protein [Mycoplasmopsis bovis]